MKIIAFDNIIYLFILYLEDGASGGVASRLGYANVRSASCLLFSMYVSRKYSDNSIEEYIIFPKNKSFDGSVVLWSTSAAV